MSSGRFFSRNVTREVFFHQVNKTPVKSRGVNIVCLYAVSVWREAVHDVQATNLRSV